MAKPKMHDRDNSNSRLTFESYPNKWSGFVLHLHAGGMSQTSPMLKHPIIPTRPHAFGHSRGNLMRRTSGKELARDMGPSRGYGGNCIDNSAAAIKEGEEISGIPTPTYATHLTAVFNTWIPSRRRTWRNEGIGPVIMATDLGRQYRADHSSPSGF